MRLSEYFQKYGIMKSVFAKKIGISPTAIQHLLNGQIPRLDRALKIEEVTEGCVKANLEDWPPKQRPQRKHTKKK